MLLWQAVYSLNDVIKAITNIGNWCIYKYVMNDNFTLLCNALNNTKIYQRFSHNSMQRNKHYGTPTELDCYLGQNDLNWKCEI